MKKKKEPVRVCDSPEAFAAIKAFLADHLAVLNEEGEKARKRDEAEGYTPPKRTFATGLIIEPPSGLM